MTGATPAPRRAQDAVDAADAPGTRAAPSRRTVLAGLAGAVAGLGAGVGATSLGRRAPAQAPGTGPTPPDVVAAPGAVAARGRSQAGVDRPATPQRAGLLVVLDLDDPGDVTWLPRLGERIDVLTAAAAPRDVLPDGAGDLTVTVGLGPRVVASVDRSLPGAEDLPTFVGDDRMPAGVRGGDVVLALHASDPGALDAAARDLAPRVPGTERWRQRMFRGPGEGTIVRNPAGFHDGVVVPRTPEQLDADVWLAPEDHARDLDGATIMVVRRLRMDLDGLARLPVPEQERVFGREKVTGAPLSGGGPTDEVDLRAKTPEGDLLVPARAHARAAHPSFTGSGLMLRRSYAYDDGGGEAGLVFVCFQRRLATFVATQHRLDEVDDLMRWVRTTASATFLVLPGARPGRPLGAALLGGPAR